MSALGGMLRPGSQGGSGRGGREKATAAGLGPTCCARCLCTAPIARLATLAALCSKEAEEKRALQATAAKYLEQFYEVGTGHMGAA